VGKYIVRNGVLAGRKFRLEMGARISIGREKGDLNFPDKRMSRTHCALEVREDGDYLEDLGSTNGSFVNEEKTKLRHLKPGDIVRVGFTEIEFLGMPEHTTLARAREAGRQTDPTKTIAFRKSDLKAAIEVVPERKLRRRSRARARLDDAKKAAMGIGGGAELISAKGKFCEACGEAIFMKEGAPDEGRMHEGLYLCRMCALIAEKQKDAGGDFLPSYAKIVGGRMGGSDLALEPGAPGIEIVSVDEISLDELSSADSPAEERAEDEQAGEGAAEELEERVEIQVQAERGHGPRAEAEKKPDEKAEEGPLEVPVDGNPPDRTAQTDRVGAPPERAGQPPEPAPEPRPEEESEGPDGPEEAAQGSLTVQDILAAVDAAIGATGEGSGGEGAGGEGSEPAQAEGGDAGQPDPEGGGGTGEPG
jgi:hypothetical protein